MVQDFLLTLFDSQGQLKRKPAKEAKETPQANPEAKPSQQGKELTSDMPINIITQFQYGKNRQVGFMVDLLSVSASNSDSKPNSSAAPCSIERSSPPELAETNSFYIVEP